jgi:cytoskeletal protein CcmA (bactofilin family)
MVRRATNALFLIPLRSPNITQKGFLMFAQRKAEGLPISAASAEDDRPAFGTPVISRNAHSAHFKGNTSSAHSIVDEFLTMRGDLESEGDIHVKGKVLGNIRCKLLIIEVDALVEGGVEAEEVIVRGNSKGTIQADRVRLEKTANVDSEIRQNSFSAEEGARIKGSLRSKDEPLGGAPQDGETKGDAQKTAKRSKAESAGGLIEPSNATAA